MCVFLLTVEWSSLYLAWRSFSWHLLLRSTVIFTERLSLFKDSKGDHSNILCHLILFFSLHMSLLEVTYFCIYLGVCVLHCLSPPSLETSFMMARVCPSFSVLYPQHVPENLVHIRHSVSILLIEWRLIFESSC